MATFIQISRLNELSNLQVLCSKTTGTLNLCRSLSLSLLAASEQKISEGNHKATDKYTNLSWETGYGL